MGGAQSVTGPGHHPHSRVFWVLTLSYTPAELCSCPGLWNGREGQSFLTTTSTTIILFIITIIFITIIPVPIITKKFKEFPSLEVTSARRQA